MELIQNSAKKMDTQFISNFDNKKLQKKWCKLNSILKLNPDYKNVVKALKGHSAQTGNT